MKPSLSLLIFFGISNISSLNAQSTIPQKTSKGGYSNPKMLESRNIFNPRMDYDEWTPLGRGDPLKNDPTYDYVPPVLERVHYWMEPSKRTPDPPLPNSGLLVLGSRTESTFTTRPTTPRYQPFQSKESQADSRIDTSSLLDPFFKLMDVSQFNLNFNSNANNHYKPTPNRIQRPHYQTNQKRPQPPQALQRPPYTMLMPPPPPPPSVQQSTLVTTTTMTTPNQITTTQPVTTSKQPLTTKNATTTVPVSLANTENVFKAVAISMPGTIKETENETNNEIKPTITYQPRKPTTATTTEAMVLPIVTMFDNVHKRPHEESKIKHQNKPNLIHHTSLPKHKSPGTYPPSRTPSQTTFPPRTVPPESTFRATTAPTFTTTKVNTLTTDPMFKHYKQPLEPIKGPFYLIIQGHSKVKTYGASKNPVNRLPTSNEIRYDDDDGKKNSLGRKIRRLNFDDYKESGNNIENSVEKERSFPSMEEENIEILEETFPKSNGGSSKKRYLGSNHRRRRNTRRLLSAEKKEEEEETNSSEEKPEDLDLESLIAISDDYDPDDVANILLKQEGSQGSGLGGLALSILQRSESDGQEVA